MKPADQWLKKLRIPIEFVATGGYLGRLPKAPGTWGTIAAIPLSVFLNSFGPTVYLAATLMLIGLAIIAAQSYETLHGGHDSKEIVIDEIVGYLVAVVFLPVTWFWLLAGFALFRFFDILKPYPISYLDRNVKGGLGVVVDDLAAGLVSSLILQILLRWTGP